MSIIFKQPISSEAVKARARELGADLVGIADGATLDENPPPSNPGRPSDVTIHDSKRIIVLAKRLNHGSARITTWSDRTKFYNDELALTELEEISLDLVYWLEDRGHPAIIIPPTHVDPWKYGNRPNQHMTTLISLPHAAVEAGLGTLGLNLQLLTPEFGPRVVLTAILCSAELVCDRRLENSLCHGPECGRCLKACPGDVIKHWDRDWEACDEFRSPYGFNKLNEQIQKIVSEPDAAKKKDMLRSKDTFYLWQSILRGAGVITGCRRCADVCPVGEDYQRLLQDALDHIPETTPDKEQRLIAMANSEARHDLPLSYEEERRWIGAIRRRKQ